MVGSLWEGFRESRRCSRDTYPESYITEYVLIYDENNLDHLEQQRVFQINPVLIDSGLVGRKVFFHHHIRPVVSGAQTHEKRRWLFEEPTQSQISTSIL